MGIKQLYNDNLRKLPKEYGDVSVMAQTNCESLIMSHSRLKVIKVAVFWLIQSSKKSELLEIKCPKKRISYSEVNFDKMVREIFIIIILAVNRN